MIEKTLTHTIPTIDKFCISLKELSETEKGRVVSVLCVVQ